jgi:hypothetical protein
MEICNILDILDINNYEAALACLNLTGCAPANFQDLINLIITQLCATNANVDSSASKVITTSSSSSEVSIAPCFYYTDPFGNTITKMTIEDYATAMGKKICDLVLVITGQQNSITDLNIRVSALEAVPAPVLILPDATAPCIGTYPLDEFTEQLATSFCDLQLKTGVPADIFSNIQKACNISSLPTLANPGSNYNSLPGWTSSVSNLAESFGNLWLLACDIRAAVLNIQTNCCPTACEGISLSLLVTANETTLNINVSGSIPGGYSQCTGTTQTTLVDGNGVTVTVNIDLSVYLNGIYTYTIAGSPLDFGTPITVTMNPCFTNGTNQCESCLEYVYSGTANCPELTAEQGMGLFIDWSITTTAAGIYTVNIYNGVSTLVYSQGAFYNPGIYTGSSTALPAGTYTVNVVATVGGVTSTCPSQEVIITEPIL